MISGLKQHTIVCGSSTMARAVVERLVRKRVDVVVVSSNPEELQELQSCFRRIFTVVGCPTDERILAQANVMGAAAVVAVMESEVDNLLVGITCKDLGREISVFARSETPSIANRMRKAGVDEVICPPQICGERVVSMLLK